MRGSRGGCWGQTSLEFVNYKKKNIFLNTVGSTPPHGIYEMGKVEERGIY
jgi:hypothetical protein